MPECQGDVAMQRKSDDNARCKKNRPIIICNIILINVRVRLYDDIGIVIKQNRVGKGKQTEGKWSIDYYPLTNQQKFSLPNWPISITVIKQKRSNREILLNVIQYKNVIIKNRRRPYLESSMT